MKRLSTFVLFLSASGLSLPAQEITTYFAVGLDQGGGPGAFVPGAGRIVTKVTLQNNGPDNTQATIRFIARLEEPASIPMLGNMAANCGPGCFAVDLPPGGNFSGATPGNDPGTEAYVRVTADENVSADVELRIREDCISSVPGETTFRTEFIFPVSWAAGTSPVISGVNPEANPGAGVVVWGGLATAQGAVEPTLEIGAIRAPTGFHFEVLSELFELGSFEGLIIFESALPIVAFQSEFDFNTACLTFPEQPVQTSPARVLNLPSLIQGAGLSTRLILGAAETPYTANTIFSAQDGTEVITQSVDVPANGTAAIDFAGGAGLDVGSLRLGIDPPDAHVLLTEVISLGGPPPIGVPSAPLCDTAEFLVVQSADSHTGGAFSNPYSRSPADCAWQVFSGEGPQLGNRAFAIPRSGQVQFFPDERVQLPEDFVGTFRATCNVPIYVFSLFQRISDLALSTNSAGCLE